MKMALWMMTLDEQDCTRRETAYFLSVAVSFRNLLHLFDAKDGIKLLLSALRHAISPAAPSQAQGAAHNRKTLANHCAAGIKQYLRAHTVLVSEHLHSSIAANDTGLHGDDQDRRRKRMRRSNSGSAPSTPKSKDGRKKPTPKREQAVSEISRGRYVLDTELQKALIQLEKSDRCLTSLQDMDGGRWRPAYNLLKYDGIRLLVETIQRAALPTWRYPDTAVFCLESLQVLLLLPSCQQSLTATSVGRSGSEGSAQSEAASADPDIDGPKRHALAIVLEIAQNGIDGRAEVYKAALR
jgi:hypothetical protein